MSFAKAEELIHLACMASRHRGVSLAEICETFGCVHRTAQRMTVALEKAFPATEQRVDHERRTRWVLATKPAMQLLTATPEEMAALSAAVALLDRSAMSTEAVLIRRLEAKVRALIPPPKERRLAVDEEALLEALGHAARPGPRLATDVDVDNAIFASLKGPYRLRMVYRSRRDNASRERVVAPHGLLLGTRRYLVARDLSKADAPLQHYRVEDIETAEVLAESSEFDIDFDIRDHARRGFGSFVNDGEHGEVLWRFKPHAAAQARRYLFHPTQSLKDEADGSLLVRFEASGHLEMCWHLYAWGDAVEVLAPEALRQMVEGFRRSDFPALP